MQPCSSTGWERIEPLDAKFAAAGYDAAIVVGAPPAETRRGNPAPRSSRRARSSRPWCWCCCRMRRPMCRPTRRSLRACTARRSTANGCCAPSRSPRASRRSAVTALRSRPDFDQIYKFGSHHDSRPPLHPPGRLRRHVQDLSCGERARGGDGRAQGVQPGPGRVRAASSASTAFMQEYEIVAGLNHPNIVRIYDLGIADDHAYIAMEHFPAGDLRQRMKMPLAPRDGGAFSRADRQCARRDSRRGRAAPGPETRQRDAARRRHALPDRFRPRQGERAGSGAHGHRARSSVPLTT